MSDELEVSRLSACKDASMNILNLHEYEALLKIRSDLALRVTVAEKLAISI